ncbi:hypothetical protein MLD38_003197 [Melastoma candidum]|uniref:Uncharacterized protein n=1 Tax=Melastoma candidum TaxID=119954 RepID=A0ACB9S1H4_9MYRT|nr:hypothetical protein MLD38_003197 [Melastoma candidum]
MVAELGLATEIKLDYRADFEVSGRRMLIPAKEIEEAIRELMEDSEQRKKVKEMSEIGKEALKEGVGSSYLSLGQFIHDILQ